MGMIVQHNMSSLNANRNLGVVSGNLSKSTEKLSSGYKINRAGDNAAGLAISEKMRGQIRGLSQASTNAQDGISLIQTAEGALTETHSILQRMRELAVQASSDTNTDDDRTQIQNEIDQLTQEVDRIATTTEFNTKKLLDGSRTGAVTEKAGRTNVEGTFSNSTISASITTDGSAKAAFTDVIRLEVTKDFDGYGSSISSTQDDVDGYETLAGDIATLKSEVDTLQGLASQKATVTDTLINNYVDATKDFLSGNADAYNAQTDAWKALSAAVKDLGAGETAKINGVTLPNSETAANVASALKDALDAIAKKEIEMASNETYQEIGAVEVEDITSATPGATKTLSALITDMTTQQPEYDAAVKAIASGGVYGLTNDTEANIKTLTNAYKTALKDAYASGMSEDEAKDSEAVVEARTALYEKFATNLKDSTVCGLTNGTVIGDLTTAAGTTKGEVTAAALDDILDKADALVKTELMKEEALSKISTSGEKSFTVTDLFGNGTNAETFEVSSTLNTDKSLNITLKNEAGDNTVITISNADKLKAGDTVTITTQAMVESKPAAVGEEALRLQIGANAGQEVALGINSMKAKDLNIVQTEGTTNGKDGAALDVSTQASASLAVNAYDLAIQKVSTERAKMGAMQNRLEHTIANLDTSAENLQSAESSLRDTDMAEEMTQFSKNNILMQAGQSMLAQANQSTQGVLSLLQ